MGNFRKKETTFSNYVGSIQKSMIAPQQGIQCFLNNHFRLSRLSLDEISESRPQLSAKMKNSSMDSLENETYMKNSYDVDNTQRKLKLLSLSLSEGNESKFFMLNFISAHKNAILRCNYILLTINDD